MRLSSYNPSASRSQRCAGRCWGEKEEGHQSVAPVTRNSRVTKVAAPRLPLRNDDGEERNVTASLRDILTYTHNQPEGHVFIVRRIQRLGYDSPSILYDYFKKELGMEVRRVMVVASAAPESPDGATKSGRAIWTSQRQPQP
mmetsp:Transcript_13517/g.13312  ORF Transcript_13517/g.13312 Transcript_13517/m.13312 type:complete len:142 (+) Transcript_13517:24-449(+)